MIRKCGFATIIGLFSFVPYTALAQEERGLCAEAGGAAASESILGVWDGELVRDGKSRPIQLAVGDDGVRLWQNDNGVVALPAETAAASGESVCAAWYWGVAVSLTRQGDALVGSWSQGEGDSLPVRMTRGETPTAFQTREYRFKSFDGTELAGILVSQPGATDLPVIVWTHGSGAQDRDTAYYASRGYLAVEAGAASFIYDKRGYGASAGGDEYATLDVLAEDALAAVRFLRTLSDVDPDRVAVGGYSQGGWLSPTVAARDQRIAAVIVGSAPGITPAEQNLVSMEGYLGGADFSSEEIALALDTLRSIYDYYLSGEGYDDLNAVLTDPANRKWAEDETYKRFLFTDDGELAHDFDPADYADQGFDALPLWRQITAPVLAVWGEMDRDVPARKSHDLIAAALEDAGNETATLKVFTNASHGLKVVRGDDEPWDWGRMAPGYMELLRSWIGANVAQNQTESAGE